MKIEELIKELEKIKEKYGNLEVYSAEEEQCNLIFHKYKFPPTVTILGNKSTCKKNCPHLTTNKEKQTMDYIQMVHSGKLPDNCPFCDSEHIYEEREVYKDEQTYTMITRIKSHVYCEHCGKTIWNIDTNPKNN